MRVVNKIVSKLGADKLLHSFLCCAVISMSLFFGWAFGIFVTFLLTIVGIYKEFSDSHIDWLDVLANEIGMATSWIVWVVALFIH